MKTLNSRLTALLLGAICTIYTMAASSTPVWNWAFDMPTQYVTPTDDVIFTATLFNDATSAETIYGSANIDLGWWVMGGACCTTALLDQYAIQNWPGFLSQFESLVLAPGESFDFTYLHLSPINGAADYGIYEFPATLSFRYKREGSIVAYEYSDVLPTIVVGSGVPPIPIPSAFLLLASGITVLVKFSRCRQTEVSNRVHA